MMTKIMVVMVAVASLVAGSAWEADAASSSKSPKRHAKAHYRHVAPQRSPDASGWYPHDSSQLQFGSARWWDQMQSEGRLSGDAH
jgi:hypothetical protein